MMLLDISAHAVKNSIVCPDPLCVFRVPESTVNMTFQLPKKYHALVFEFFQNFVAIIFNRLLDGFHEWDRFGFLNIFEFFDL